MDFTEEKVLKIIALTIGTTTDKEIPSHHLRYLLKKLYGLDYLSLDKENTELYNQLVEIKEDF